MRIVLSLAFALFSLPAFAQDWSHYDNGRFGYGIDIPPGFNGSGKSDNGDGQEFQDADNSQGLKVWGSTVLMGLEVEIATAIGSAQNDAWTITMRETLPESASFSATKGERILQHRMILLCDGQSYAAFRMEYPAADSAEMEPVVKTLAQSFEADGC